MTREEAAATGLDVVESAATAVGQRGGGLGAAGQIVAAGARVASGLLRSGLTPEEVVERIEAIRPARDEEIDDQVDELIDQMPGTEPRYQSGSPGGITGEPPVDDGEGDR